MGFLTLFSASVLASVFLLQAVTGFPQSTPRGNFSVDLSKRQNGVADLYTYRGHACAAHPQIDPVPAPGILHCEPSPAKTPKDSHGKRVAAVAESFCITYFRPENQDPVDMPNEKTMYVTAVSTFDDPIFHDVINFWNETIKPADDVYDFKVDWVEGCATDGRLYHVTPMEKKECTDLFKSIWKRCNNQGRGGMLELGCLTYSIVTRF